LIAIVGISVLFLGYVAVKADNSPGSNGQPVTVPKQLIGTWRGTVKDTGSSRTVELTLSLRENVGEAYYPDAKCDGAVLPQPDPANRGALNQMKARMKFPTTQRQCAVGDVVLLLSRGFQPTGGELTFNYQEDYLRNIPPGDIRFSGVLTQQR
jgi:hypothetical protein